MVEISPPNIKLRGDVTFISRKILHLPKVLIKETLDSPHPKNCIVF